MSSDQVMYSDSLVKLSLGIKEKYKKPTHQPKDELVSKAETIPFIRIEELPFICSTCGKTFSRKNVLSRSMNPHLAKKDPLVSLYVKKHLFKAVTYSVI